MHRWMPKQLNGCQSMNICALTRKKNSSPSAALQLCPHINTGQSKRAEIIFQSSVLTRLISSTERKQHNMYQSSDAGLFLSCYFCSACLHGLCVSSHIFTINDWPRTFLRLVLFSGQVRFSVKLYNSYTLCILY